MSPVVFFWVWDGDQHHVPRLIQQIQDAYGAESRFVALGDGPISPDIESAIQAAGGIFRPGPHLKQQGSMEEYLFRGYQAVLRLEARHYIQVDPDSQILRAPELPADNWAGHIYWESHYKMLGTVGAGVCFSRGLLEVLVAYLQREVTGRTAYYYQRVGVSLPSADCTLAHYLKILGFTPSPWTDGNGFRQVSLLSPGFNAAIVHSQSDRVYQNRPGLLE